MANLLDGTDYHSHASGNFLLTGASSGDADRGVGIVTDPAPTPIRDKLLSSATSEAVSSS